MALGTLFKIYPVILLAFFTLKRRWWAIGGYALVRVANRGEAVELAVRFPHARWGPVEVREILFFDRI